MRKFFLSSVLFFVLFCPLLAGAAPVFGKEYTLSQPDGSPVTVRVWGDEFYRVMETLDGRTVVRDPATGYICYARVSADARKLESSGDVVGKSPLSKTLPAPHVRISAEAAAAQIKEARAGQEVGRRRFLAEKAAKAGKSAKSAPVVGTMKGLCLLVDFSDDVATVSASVFDNFCNQVGYSGNGNHGSVRDYFYDVSNTALTYTTFVAPAYYRAAHPRSYYEDPAFAQGIRAGELIHEALQYLDGQGHDFSQYDANGDGYIDAINCLYAGTRRPDWAQGLWPHSGYYYGFSADGVMSQRYQITDIGAYPTLGTYCHENGHMICDYPDLYDYGYESNGVGFFCLMAYGAYDVDPVEPCGYLKNTAGWATVTDLTLGTSQTALPVSATASALYRIQNPANANESYIIENREAVGRDAGLPTSGLAVWHVDTAGSNDNEQMLPNQHYLVTLVQADGRWDLEHQMNYGDASDLFGSGLTECGPATNPSTNWWDGNPSMFRISAVSVPATVVTFDFGPPNAPLFSVAPAHLDRVLAQGTVSASDTIQVANGAPVSASYTLAISNESVPGIFSIAPGGGSASASSVLHTLSYAAGGLIPGNYTALLTLEAPTATNTPLHVPLHLTVVPSLAEALDSTGVTWTVAGNADWRGDNVVAAYGGDAARSGIIGDWQSSTLRTQIIGPASIQFNWRVSSELNYDYLRFFIDGVEQPGKISGETAWATKNFTVPASLHTLEWKYDKDMGVSEGEDIGWVDRVALVEDNCTPESCAPFQPLGYLPGDPVCLSVPCPLWGADTFVWSRNGVPLVDNVRFSGVNARTLHISAVDYSDEGHYTCAYARGAQPVGEYAAEVVVVESLPLGSGVVCALLGLLAFGFCMIRARRIVKGDF